MVGPPSSVVVEKPGGSGWQAPFATPPSVHPSIRWWDLLCVSTRGEIQFPSVPDRALQHLSACRINELRAMTERLSHTPVSHVSFRRSPFDFSKLDALELLEHRKLCQTSNPLRTLNAISPSLAAHFEG